MKHNIYFNKTFSALSVGGETSAGECLRNHGFAENMECDP